jgi:hypothetical protein
MPKESPAPLIAYNQLDMGGGFEMESRLTQNKSGSSDSEQNLTSPFAVTTSSPTIKSVEIPHMRDV